MKAVEDEMLDRVKEVAQRISNRVRKAMGDDTEEVSRAAADDPTGEAPPVVR